MLAVVCANDNAYRSSAMTVEPEQSPRAAYKAQSKIGKLESRSPGEPGLNSIVLRVIANLCPYDNSSGRRPSRSPTVRNCSTSLIVRPAIANGGDNNVGSHAARRIPRLARRERQTKRRARACRRPDTERYSSQRFSPSWGSAGKGQRSEREGYSRIPYLTIVESKAR
jgi:hypothetical protein